MSEDYEQRVQAYEAEGICRSDAQAIVEAEDLQAARNYAENSADLDAIYFGA